MAADPFDETDLASVLRHAEKIRGKTIAEIAAMLDRPDLIDSLSGKGRQGQAVQAWFGVHQHDNDPRPDLRRVRFEGSRFQGLEIKVVPLESKTDDLGQGVKERTKIGNINYKGLAESDADWHDASVRSKLEHMLLIFYRYEGGAKWTESRVREIYLWDFGRTPKDDRRTIEDDWGVIRDKVKSGFASVLSEGDTLLLKASRSGAGAKAGEKLVSYLLDAPAAPSRAYSLSQGHMNVVWRRDVNGLPVRRITKGKKDPEGQVLKHLHRFAGRRIGEIRAPKSRTAKDSAAQIVKGILGAAPSEILEFIERPTAIKVVPVLARTGTPTEHTSFPRMWLTDFESEQWEESDLLSRIGSILFIPTFLAAKKTEPENRVLGKAFFWHPNVDELAGIKAEWLAYQRQVQKGDCETTEVLRGKKLVKVSRLRKASETEYIHMRPHGADGDDTDTDSHGNDITKQSFWLNAQFVKRLIEIHGA